MDTQKRLETFMEAMPRETDGALVMSPVSRRYLTGFASSAGVLLVLHGAAYFIIDSRYDEAARNRIRGCEVLLQEQLYEQVAALCKKHGAKNLAVESASLTLREYRLWRDKLSGLFLSQDDWTSGQIEAQRAVKSGEEIEYIAQAQHITDDTFAHITQYIQPGMTEREIALELEFYARKKGAEGTAFPFIVVSGKNSSMPHGVPGDKPVERGDFITMDFGVMVGGYCSDMTRTVAMGEVSERQRQVYETVLRAQLAALEAIKPGEICQHIDRIARDIIDNSPFFGRFGHGLGHSLGLEVHENPNFHTRCEVVLQPGHVLSVEPGIYLPGEFGVRIEDIIAVTGKGCRNMTKSPKQLLII